MILIWFDDAKGEPNVLGTGDDLNVEFLAAGKVLERLGSAYMAKYDSMRTEPGAFAKEAKAEGGKGTKVDFGERGSVTITEVDCGILIALNDEGYMNLDVGLGVQPTAVQLWSAAAMVDELARFNLRGKIAENERRKMAGMPAEKPVRKLEIARSVPRQRN